jgi:hypothetical protein
MQRIAALQSADKRSITDRSLICTILVVAEHLQLLPSGTSGMSILSESVITLAEAARRLPGCPHVSTLHRWRTRGLRGVRLRTSKIGGKRMVALRALEEFCAAVTAASDGKRQQATHNSKRREREIAKVEGELTKLGIISTSGSNEQR